MTQEDEDADVVRVQVPMTADQRRRFRVMAAKLDYNSVGRYILDLALPGLAEDEAARQRPAEPQTTEGGE